jgi:hypothetical protein
LEKAEELNGIEKSSDSRVKDTKTADVLQFSLTETGIR